MSYDFLHKEKLETRHEINNWLQYYVGLEGCTINDDLTVDVEGDVTINYKDMEKIPIQFGKVSGDFKIRGNRLTSLKGCPNEVGGSFQCSYNQLTSLEHCPKKVGGHFDCMNNNLKSLDHIPESIGDGCKFFVVLKNVKPNDPIDKHMLQDFKDNKYYEVDPLELLQYVKSEKMYERLKSNLPSQSQNVQQKRKMKL